MDPEPGTRLPRLPPKLPGILARHQIPVQLPPGEISRRLRQLSLRRAQREIHTVPPSANPASPPAVAGTRNGPPSQEPAAMAARQLSAARRASPQTEALRREPSNDEHRAGIRAASASRPVMNSSQAPAEAGHRPPKKAGSQKQRYAPLDPMYLRSDYPAIGANKSAGRAAARRPGYPDPRARGDRCRGGGHHCAPPGAVNTCAGLRYPAARPVWRNSLRARGRSPDGRRLGRNPENQDHGARTALVRAPGPAPCSQPMPNRWRWSPTRSCLSADHPDPLRCQRFGACFFCPSRQTRRVVSWQFRYAVYPKLICKR